MELYLHIPFCACKCAYCDFLSFANRTDVCDRYEEALLRDIACGGNIAPVLTSKEKLPVETVFFGGGTPSLMPVGFYSRILGRIREVYDLREDAEITIECNPGTVTPEKLKEYRDAGINRVSFGAQSADDAELRLLGRIHVWEDVEASVAMAREAGFDNISLDLMMNLPGQTEETFAGTLRRAVGLSPEHISAYSLILEPGTPFFERYASRPDLLPDEETACATYENTVRQLGEAGYAQYEISNFAKEGRECRHNLGYWRRKEYLGLGLGAASLVGERRYTVARDLDSYLRELRYESVERLSAKDIRNETVMLGLRTTEGIRVSELRERFGEDCARSLFGKMKRYCDIGLAVARGPRGEELPERARADVFGTQAWKRGDIAVALTTRGLLVSNTVLADLLE